MDEVLVLTALHNKSQAKRFYLEAGKIVKENYGNAYKHQPTTYYIENIQELAFVLEHLRGNIFDSVIRGKLKEDYRGGPICRSYLLKKNRPAPDIISGGPKNWIMLDIDSLPYPDGDDSLLEYGPEFAIQYCLPALFHNSSYYYTFSSSTGVYGWNTISIHLWFWLKTPWDDIMLKKWFIHHAGGIDTSVFQPVQPHYVADPIFQGIEDPIPKNKRSGFVSKTTDVIDIPFWEPPARPKLTVAQKKELGGNKDGWAFREKVLEIGTSPHRMGHLMSAIASAAGTWGSYMDRAWVKEVIRARLLEHWRGDADTNYVKDDWLDDRLRTAIERFGGDADRRLSNVTRHIDNSIRAKFLNK